MHEVIKQIEERCWEELGEEEAYYPVFNTERFAELIVRECLKVMDAEAKDARDYNTYMGDDVPTFRHQCSILSHFGLKHETR